MACEWTQELDLALAGLIRQQWGAEVWDTASHKTITWELIFVSSRWPEGFTKETLKERWQDNFRKWVPRQDQRRANSLSFDTLMSRIQTHDYSRKPRRKYPEISFKSNETSEIVEAVAQQHLNCVEGIQHISSSPELVQSDWPTSDANALAVSVLSPAMATYPFCEDILMESSLPDAALFGLESAAAAIEPLPSILQEDAVGIDLTPPSGASSSSSNRKRRDQSSSDESPASASSPPPSITLSTSLSSSPSSSPAATSLAQPSTQGLDPLVTELLTLIDWPGSSQRPKAKRSRGPAAMTREKHVASEAARRGMLAEAIDEVGKLMPQQNQKQSKVATLLDAAEYCKRIQDVALVLLDENKRLTAALERRAAGPVAAPASRGDESKYGADIVRLMMVSFFMVWLFVGTPLSFLSSSQLSHYNAGDSRHVLEATSASSASAAMTFGCSVISSLGRFAWTALSAFAVFIVLYIAALLQDVPRVAPERVAEAKSLLERAHENMCSELPDWQLVNGWHSETMRLLGKPLPHNKLSAAVFFGMQIVRVCMQRLWIGYYIEMLLMRFMKREGVTAVEARAYIFASFFRTMNPERSANISVLSVPFFGCVLAAVANSSIGHSTDELLHLHSAVLSHLPLQPIPIQFVLWLAFSGLGTATDQDLFNGEWSTIHLIREPLDQGRLYDALGVLLHAVPRSSGDGRVRLLSITGMVYAAMRKYDQSFLLHSTAIQLSNKGRCFATRFLALSVVLELCALRRIDDARKLLQDFYTLVPTVKEDGFGILPAEHILLSCARTACLEDQSDYAAIMAHATIMMASLRLLGLCPLFTLPCLVEMMLDSLMPALEIDPKSNFYVAGHRGEIVKMVDEMIHVMTRSAHCNWSRLVAPIVQRVTGWRVHVGGDKATALYHFKRSLLEAEMVEGLEGQSRHTVALMRRLGVDAREIAKAEQQIASVVADEEVVEVV